jgi:hypothetical protein
MVFSLQLVLSERKRGKILNFSLQPGVSGFDFKVDQRERLSGNLG